MKMEIADHVAGKMMSLVICHNEDVIIFWQGFQRRERGKLRNKPNRKKAKELDPSSVQHIQFWVQTVPVSYKIQHFSGSLSLGSRRWFAGGTAELPF